jgi:hypothetical protein
MTQQKTIKEKAVEEGRFELLKRKRFTELRLIDGTKRKFWHENDVDIAIQKTVDTYADEVKKVIEKWLDENKNYFGIALIENGDYEILLKRLGLK